MRYNVNVSKTPTPGLYRVTYGRSGKQITGMIELQAGGWMLFGAYHAGPFKTKREAKQRFEAYAVAAYEAGGQRSRSARREGQLAVRRVDPMAPLPEPVSADPLPMMAPEMAKPMEPDELRAADEIDQGGALRLIRHHKSITKLYGADPWWKGDRKRIIENGHAHLLTMTDFERREIEPHIKA